MVDLELKVHPAAELFPLMPDAELRELADDIKANGLIEPIALFNGLLLDGRNRLRACELAGVQPTYAEAHLNGHGTPEAFVIAKNLHRRHLTPGQCAAIGVRLLPALRAANKISKGGRPKKELPALVPEVSSTSYQRESSTIAGLAVGVSGTSIKHAERLQRVRPDLFVKVASGETQLKVAVREMKGLPPKKERATPAPKERTERKMSGQRKNAVKSRFIDIISTARGLCRGLDRMNLKLVVERLSVEERRDWQRVIGESIQVLRKAVTQLKGEPS